MAGPTVKVEFSGQAAVIRNLDQLELTKRNKAIYLIKRTSLEIMNDAKIAAPADMGLLRSSIRPTYYQNGLTAYIGSNVKYAAFLEYGTGPLGRSTNSQTLPDGYTHGSGGKMPPVVLIREWCRRKGIPENLAFVIARKIGRHGMKARPYLGPAFEKHRAEFERELLAIVNDLPPNSGFTKGAPASMPPTGGSSGGRRRDSKGRFI